MKLPSEFLVFISCFYYQFYYCTFGLKRLQFVMFSSIKWTTKHPTIKTFWLVNDMWKSDDLFYQKKTTLPKLLNLHFINIYFRWLKSQVTFFNFFDRDPARKRKMTLCKLQKVGFTPNREQTRQENHGLVRLPAAVHSLKKCFGEVKEFWSKIKASKKATAILSEEGTNWTPNS